MNLKNIEWGDDSAEKDENLLSYFVSTESYNRLSRKSKSLIIGRKGSGKSALRKKLESDFISQNDTHVINISPKYSSIRNIINDKSLRESFGEEIFFQHSWLRQMMLDALCMFGHKAKSSYATDSMAYARNIAKELNRTSKDIVENISDILSRIKVKAGNLGELGLQLEKELRNVADVDSLEHHLKEIASSGAKTIIMVDDLDLGWDLTKDANPFSQLTDYDVKEKARKVCYRCGWSHKMELPENQHSNSYDLVSFTNLEVLTKNKRNKPYKVISKENNQFNVSEIKNSQTEFIQLKVK